MIEIFPYSWICSGCLVWFQWHSPAPPDQNYLSWIENHECDVEEEQFFRNVQDEEVMNRFDLIHPTWHFA